ncbi:hypothetical protein DIPPA_11899 [Diplonema papillatum]|nr:hypothetical protein DIPPA_11899 [Diplonema papillatum]
MRVAVGPSRAAVRLTVTLLLLSAASDAVQALGCRNTKQGRHLVCDSEGIVCDAEITVDGCCPQEEDRPMRYVCDSCLDSAKCCEVYEHCVSCCMSPQQRATRASGFAKRKAVFPYFRDVIRSGEFSYCAARCRTSSRSVYHQNRYSTPDHVFCFGSALDDGG